MIFCPRSRARDAITLAVVFACLAVPLAAQDVAPTDVDANVDIDSQSEVRNDAEAQSGGNVFDFSSNSRNTPPGPNIGAFGGASCVGPGQAVSGSAPGFSLGVGQSFEDESCQRRNWVQTMIGAAQHMPEAEAKVLKQAAVEIMMQDDYAGEAFRALGYESAKDRKAADGVEQPAGQDASRDAPAPETEQRRGRIAASCEVVIPRGAPGSVVRLLKAQGCTPEVQ